MADISFTIEPARGKHARRITLLYKETWAEIAHLLGPQLTEARQASLRTVAEWIHHDPYFVACDGKKVVGVVGAEPRHGTVHMVHMVVHKDYRRHGIGTALVERVEKFARANNATKVWFDTHPELQDATRLYEKMGYQNCGFFKKHYWGIDIVLYEKLL
jgi:ribosomal protein S18 acetylase RimI-like enzyme